MSPRDSLHYKYKGHAVLACPRFQMLCILVLLELNQALLVLVTWLVTWLVTGRRRKRLYPEHECASASERHVLKAEL